MDYAEFRRCQAHLNFQPEQDALRTLFASLAAQRLAP
jgi:hypothetical protein